MISPTGPHDYGIERWGNGYYKIGENGRLLACPDPDGSISIDLYRLAEEIRESGLSWPTLIRFSNILHHRVGVIFDAFRVAMKELEYTGGYTLVYPIKVNQQRVVVDEILNGKPGGVGLEAGSKPELMAVLAHSYPNGIIVCNGYKDREYIRLALIGQTLGHRIYTVIDKLSEIELVLEEAEDLGITPLLGVRLRLASTAAGNWQGSGGHNAKFGLNSLQLLQLIERLKQENMLDCLRLLHAHIGSQIPNLRDIRHSMSEVARFYGEFIRLGASIDIIDVGGGLGIDYEGTATRHHCSMNYSAESYAREVVKALKRVCQEQGLPMPDIFSESGRAVTAHHAVLLANVSDRERAPESQRIPEVTEDAPEVLRTMATNLADADAFSALELYHEAEHGLEEAHELFQQGFLDLAQRAIAEQIYYATCRMVQPLLRADSLRHHETLEQINAILAEKLFVNMSLFQSLPDVWAVDQIFPVMPLHRLDEPASCNAMLHDLTCDSDGCINEYVGQKGVESTLRVHCHKPSEPYLIGFFLVGAYQEILGDLHNLFGDTDTVNIELTEDGYRLTQPEQGDTIDEMLRYVHFDTDAMLERYRRKLQTSGIPSRIADHYYDELKAGLYGYTYLED